MKQVSYVVFLRGINVGRNTKVPMKELKEIFDSLGFKNVKTLLNSGNIIFESLEEDQSFLIKKIEDKLEKTFGFRIIVLLRMRDQIKKIAASHPFQDVVQKKGIQFYVTFLPDSELFNIVDSASKTTTELMKNLDKEFGKNITTRNWNTIIKIANL